MNKKKIIILGDTIGLPVGYAASTRTQFIASSLAEAGMDVDILLIKPSEAPTDIKNTQTIFKLGKASVYYTCGTTTLSHNWFKRRSQSLNGLLNACKHLYIHRNETQAIIIYSRNIDVVMAIGLFARLYGIKSVLELCEWPLTQPTTNLISRLKKKLFCKYSLMFVDGVLYISQYIKNRIKEFEDAKRKKINKFHLPILCDSSEFNAYPNESVIEGKVVYCGNLSYRSLLERTLKIMKQVISINKSVTLLIVGSSTDQNDLVYLKNRVDHYQLTENVTITGYVPRNKLIKIYKSAYAFLLPLEDEKLSEARFPTKLAEYLLSGRPVIVPDVGEISYFLKRNVSFVSPTQNTTTGFVKSLDYIVSNSNVADNIGHTGKEVAIRFFDFRHYRQSLSRWLIKLENNNA